MNFKGSTKRSKFMSRLTSTVLAVGLIMSIVPTTAFAAKITGVNDKATKDTSGIKFAYADATGSEVENEFFIPSNGKPEQTGEIKVTGNTTIIADVDGKPADSFAEADIFYSISKPTTPLGVTINSADGKITIDGTKAKPGTITVRADYNIAASGSAAAIPSYQEIDVKLVANLAAPLEVASDGANKGVKAKFGANNATFTLKDPAIGGAIFNVYNSEFNADGTEKPDSPDYTNNLDGFVSVTVDQAKKTLTLKTKDSKAALPEATYWITQVNDITYKSEGAAFKVTNPKSEIKGKVKFDFATGKLTGTSTSFDYSVNGNDYKACIDSETTLTKEELAALNTRMGIIVRVTADPLDYDIIHLFMQEAPDVQATATTSATSKDGKITVLDQEDEKFEYMAKENEGKDWMEVKGTEVTGLESGTYLVRTAGRTTYLPSKPTTVSVLKNGEKATQTGIRVIDAGTMEMVLDIDGNTTFKADEIIVGKLHNDGSITDQSLVTDATQKITTSIKNGAVLTGNDKVVKITWGTYSVDYELLLNYIDIGTQQGAVRAGDSGKIKFTTTLYGINTAIPYGKIEVVFKDKDGKDIPHGGITVDNTTAGFDKNGNQIVEFTIDETAKAGSYSFGAFTQYVVKSAASKMIYTAGKLTVSATGGTTPPVTPSTGGNNNNYYYGGSSNTGTSPKVPENTAASAGAVVKADGAIISGAGVPAGAKLTVVSALSPSAGEAFPSFVTGKANAATVSALNGFATRGALKGVFNISLDKALTSAVTVTIPTTNLIPDQSVTVIHVKDDGTSEYLVGTANKNGNLIVPGVKSLSPFIVLNAIYQPTASGTTGGIIGGNTTGGTTGGDTTSTVPKTGVELLAPLF